MKTTLALKLYEIFKSKPGQQEAEAIIEYFEAATEKKYEEKKDFLATKEDVGLLKKEIAESKADTVKWMFIFWIGQIAATLGIIAFFLKK